MSSNSVHSTIVWPFIIAIFLTLFISVLDPAHADENTCNLQSESSPPIPKVSRQVKMELVASFFDPNRLHAVQGIDLEFDESGAAETVLVSAGGLHNLGVFDGDLKPKFFQRAPQSFAEPNRSGDVVSFKDGRIGLLTYDNPYVTVFSRSGEVLSQFNRDMRETEDRDTVAFLTPVGLALDADENLVIADRGNSRIITATTEGKFISFFKAEIPYDVIRVEDCFLVSLREEKVLSIFHADGRFSHTIDVRLADAEESAPIETSFALNQHVSLGPDGMLYVVDTAAFRILVLHPTGVVSEELTHPILGTIRSAVVDEKGNIYTGGFKRDAHRMGYPGREAGLFKFRRPN